MSTGIFADVWKVSYISHVFKTGGKRNFISDYRPVSKISLIPKIMESLIVFLRILSYLTTWFLQKKSINTNLILYTEYISSGFEDGFMVDFINADFSKSFNNFLYWVLMEHC